MNSALDWRNVGMLVLIGFGVVWWMKRQAGEAVGGIADAWGALADAINFNPGSLGAQPQLTEGALQSQEWYIKQGYLEKLPDGRTRITPEGELYIERMQRVNQ